MFGKTLPIQAADSLTAFLEANIAEIESQAAALERDYVECQASKTRDEAIERRAHANVLRELSGLIAPGKITKL